MEQVRYRQRNWADAKEIEQFLKNTRTAVVGIQGKEYPYCVPVNHIWQNQAIYFHGMGSGKKTELLKENPGVCITVYEEMGTVRDAVPCHADTSYKSVMIFGPAVKVSDHKEAAEALQAIVDKFLPDFYKSVIKPELAQNYRSSHDNKGVAVYKVIPEIMTAKHNTADPEQIYRPKHGG